MLVKRFEISRNMSLDGMKVSRFVIVMMIMIIIIIIIIIIIQTYITVLY